jgi:hypothetical protein
LPIKIGIPKVPDGISQAKFHPGERNQERQMSDARRPYEVVSGSLELSNIPVHPIYATGILELHGARLPKKPHLP